MSYPIVPSVLLTGFEPFGGESTNPSWGAVHALAGERIAGHDVVVRQLPVEFGRALAVLDAALAEVAPSLVICVGQAGGRAQLSLERVAINVDDARIPDNAGARPVDRPVAPDGPAAYFSSLPIKAILATLQEAGLPAEVSQTAGTYVCNHVFYGLMHRLQNVPGVRGGFIHIPYAPEQAAHHPGAPSLSSSVVSEALRLAIATALTVERDIPLAAGATH